eukprot:GHVS01006226.1.p1 GENE.GHVS01006226.1~~GHVS01006226.1.p1  ORF type:complete len:375 (-),score=57.23 GHVS01006226.1:593-1717(-)
MSSTTSSSIYPVPLGSSFPDSSLPGCTSSSLDDNRAFSSPPTSSSCPYVPVFSSLSTPLHTYSSRRLASLSSLLLICCLVFSLLLMASSARPDYCRSARLPRSTFSAQSDPNLVYNRVDAINDQAFANAGLTKFVTVFGVRIVASPSVSDAKLLHTMKVMAKMLDNDEEGRPQNPTLVNTLYRRSATLGFVQTDLEMNDIFDALPKEYACFLFLVLELENNIIINGQAEQDCPQMRIGSERGERSRGMSDNRYVDRTIGLVGDFLIQSGYPTIYPSDSELGALVEAAFVRSKRRGWFIPSSSSRRCDANCQRVSFQSWALSSALGVDACSCRKFGAWKLCTPEEMRRADPTLFSAILEDMQVPSGRYDSLAIVH